MSHLQANRNPGWLSSALAVLLLCCSAARADAIADWNAIAATAVTASGRSDSYERSQVMAMVSVAMFEAVNLNEGRNSSLLRVSSPAPQGASSEAAAAAAAHYVLSQIYPEQQASFSVALARSLEAVPDGPEKVLGQVMGTKVGKDVYAALRRGAPTTPAEAPSR